MYRTGNGFEFGQRPMYRTPHNYAWDACRLQNLKFSFLCVSGPKICRIPKETGNF